MKRILALLLCTLLCTSCTALPAEERAFTVVLGVDRKDATWHVHARIPTYQTGGGYTTLSAEGATLAHALSALDDAAPMHLHLDQLRLLVFSQSLAQSAEFPSALATFSARHDLRMQAAVAVTDAEMPALFEALKPTTGSRLSKSLDVLLATRREQGVIPSDTLADVLRMGERQSPVLLAVSLEGEDITLSGGYPISQEGTATAPLSPEDMQLLSLMQGRLTQGTLNLPETTLRILDTTTDISLSTPTMRTATVRLTLRCDGSALTEEALRRSIATACLGLLNGLSAANCDALGLGRQAMQHMADSAEWHAFDWPARYPEIDWSVSVGVQFPAT